MRKVIQFSITNEDGCYVASGVNAPIVADGGTFEELEKNIQEAVFLYLEEMRDEKTDDQKEFIKFPAIIANFEFPTPSYA